MRSLRESYFLKRIILLLCAALVLWTLFTSVLYRSISKPVFLKMRTADLMPQAEWVANRTSANPRQIDRTITNLVQVSYNFFKVWTFIYDSYGEPMHTPLPSYITPEQRDAIMERTGKMHLQLMDVCSNRSCLERFPFYEDELLYVGTPIYANGQQDKDLVIGSVIMIQPMTEVKMAMRSHQFALLLGSLLVGFLLVLPVAYIASQMVEPLHRIRLLAVAMTRGDFSSRAEEKGRGEIFDLAVAMNHMSEQLRRNFRQLSLEKTQLKQVIDGIAEGIIAVDKEGQVTQTNAAIWKLFQRDPRRYPIEQILAQYELDEGFEEAMRENRAVTHRLHLAEDQKRIHCHITPLSDHEGVVSAAVGLFRDVTESDRLEQMRRDYIANVSHEFRTPITAMRGLLEPLNEGLVHKSEDQKRYYGILLRETLRLSRLIDDMLELSRIQAGTQSMQLGPVSLSRLLIDLEAQFEILAKEQGIQFVYEGPAQSLPLVWSNLDRLEQILLIFFDNALKFTPAGGQITLSVALHQEQMQLRLKDTGKGIRAEDLPYVFDRFYKADKAHNESGTGLGLSIAKIIADHMNVSIAASSAEGQGALFTLGIAYASDVLRADRHLKDVYDCDDEEQAPTDRLPKRKRWFSPFYTKKEEPRKNETKIDDRRKDEPETDERGADLHAT